MNLGEVLIMGKKRTEANVKGIQRQHTERHSHLEQQSSRISHPSDDGSTCHDR